MPAHKSMLRMNEGTGGYLKEGVFGKTAIAEQPLYVPGRGHKMLLGPYGLQPCALLAHTLSNAC